MSAKRVLLVEDEALIALYIEETLTDAGYDVVGPADRLEAALDLAANEALDGAVLDVNLDGVAVWPLATLLRERGIPFIFLTGFGGGLSPPADCRDAPCVGKPFKEDVLLETLAGICGSVCT
jgi:DNA-binding response OmpR family regulator